MQRIILFLWLFSTLSCHSSAQNTPPPSIIPTFLPSKTKTANDGITSYMGSFRYGANMGWHPPYTDEQIADIAAGNPALGVTGVGVNTLRPALFEHFLEQWGYDARVATFQHYADLGIRDNTVFIGYPSDAHRDKTLFCGKDSAVSFKNLYEPIWDNGENGTPVNDKNYYALYCWKVVNKYKFNVKFWEIWNEPDYAVNTYNNELPADNPASWWRKDPSPCEYAMHAPIQHYVRLLRISYEVIKKADPNAYVAIGGIGFPSFLDGVCRNTDNPDGGKPTPQYPSGGGAYFDVLSYHTYPHIDNSVREWSNFINGFQYFRHSDRAVDGVFNRKIWLEKVLEKYEYNGKKYPKKYVMITESNLPRRRVGEFLGSDEVQKNFLMKCLIRSQKEYLLQFHVYSIGELQFTNQIKSEFDAMGLYEKLEGTKLYSSPLTEGGIAWRTTALSLAGFRYDAAETAKLNLAEKPKCDGAAFKNDKGEIAFCLWAKTKVDLSEEADAMFSLPAHLSGRKMENRTWNWSQKTIAKIVDTREVLLLNATPQFFMPLPFDFPEPPKEEGLNVVQKGEKIYIALKTDDKNVINLEVFDIQSQKRIKILDNANVDSEGKFCTILESKTFKKGLNMIEFSIGKKKFTKKIIIP